jgi:EmrB/QacA subfamily drug resistance transporter
VKAAPAPVWALAAAVVGSGMSFIDGTAVNVALPVLQRDLRASAESVAWVVEGYTLFLSALMLIGGSLGDRFGRRRVYAVGIALFALASVSCGLATNVGVLIVARCVQGIGGALATPGSLALIAASYEGAARGRAIGTWSGASAVLSAVGPVLGGTLVQVGSWRYVFLINAPLAALVLVILAFRVRESRDPSALGEIDVTGAVLVTLGLGALVYGLIRLQSGIDSPGIVAVVAGTFALAAFVFVERRSTHPMVSLALFGSRTFTVANLYTFLLYATLGGGLYFIPFDLIDARGYEPAIAGAALLPFVAIVFPLSRFSGGLVARVDQVEWNEIQSAAERRIRRSLLDVVLPRCRPARPRRRRVRRAADHHRDERGRIVACRRGVGNQQRGLANRGSRRDRRPRDRVCPYVRRASR